MGKPVKPTVISIEPNAELEMKQGYVAPLQSANVLFKFIKKIDYLKDALRNKAIIPRYNEENISYINIKYKKIAFPMICFCDIQLNRLAPHMKNYGSCGIGLNKEWGISKGIQPIQYINSSSSLISDFRVVISKAFEAMDKASDKDKKIIMDYANYLITNLLFMKPLVYQKINFHDEREWRFIPDVTNSKNGLPSLVPQKYLNLKAYTSYSDGISKCKNLWLKFKYENIKYLIVKDNTDRIELIKFIESEITAIETEKLILISKILVFNDLKEDW